VSSLNIVLERVAGRDLEPEVSESVVATVPVAEGDIFAPRDDRDTCAAGPPVLFFAVCLVLGMSVFC
jgi:hypothetical protein